MRPPPTPARAPPWHSPKAPRQNGRSAVEGPPPPAVHRVLPTWQPTALNLHAHEIAAAPTPLRGRDNNAAGRGRKPAGGGRGEGRRRREHHGIQAARPARASGAFAHLSSDARNGDLALLSWLAAPGSGQGSASEGASGGHRVRVRVQAARLRTRRVWLQLATVVFPRGVPRREGQRTGELLGLWPGCDAVCVCHVPTRAPLRGRSPASDQPNQSTRRHSVLCAAACPPCARRPQTARAAQARSFGHGDGWQSLDPVARPESGRSDTPLLAKGSVERFSSAASKVCSLGFADKTPGHPLCPPDLPVLGVLPMTLPPARWLLCCTTFLKGAISSQTYNKIA